MTTRLTYLRLLLLTGILLPGCKKDFLDKLPSTALVVPQTLNDYQQTLDNTTVTTWTPVLGEVSADNFYLPAAFWQTLDNFERNAYVWAPDLYDGQGQVDDWDQPYAQVYYANVVLEGLRAIAQNTQNGSQWQSEQGSALFIRAYAFYHIAQLFAPPYNDTTAVTDLGIPLKLRSDVTAPSVRASVADSYARILTDLRQARMLLPPDVPTQNLNRPSQPAALAMLARACLSMRNYELAGRYADSALQDYNTLIDYNTVPAATPFPFNKLNAETIYQSNVVKYTQCLAAIAFPNTLVDSTLYSSYSSNDLRRSLFYLLNTSGQPTLKGGYAGGIWPFTGLATDELYLIRAECSARAGNTAAALADLDTLLTHRYKTGTFVPVTAASPEAALDSVLSERRKELPFRGLRWTDLRRLNIEGRNITPTRILNGTTYRLPPNSNLYTLPLPPDVLSYNPTMQQNKR